MTTEGTGPLALRRRRVAWWRRFETRVVAALVVIGTLCVGASVYLSKLTVGYYDVRLAQAWQEGEAALAAAEPFHAELVDATIAGFSARSQQMALELDLVAREQGVAALEDAANGMFTSSPDLLVLEVTAANLPPVHLHKPGAEQVDRYDADAASGSVSLHVAYAIDPRIDERYQALGRRKRSLAVARAVATELDEAVVRVVSGASLLVLLVSLAAGLILARALTRKVSRLSATIDEVAAGNMHARAPEGRSDGNDELGALADAFNEMLDRLQTMQTKIAYLQRIGAWQDMARRIAHEIKNPLTPIALAAQQLRKKAPTGDPGFTRMLGESVEIIEDEVAALRRMVTEFSRFAKVPEVRLAPVELERIFAEFARAYGHLTDDEHDELIVATPPPGVVVAADRQLLKQVLVNLVENAVLSIKEQDRGPARVEISTQVEPSSVTIAVDDNGPGVERERRERIFEPYETSRARGSGLGLAIVKKVLLDHGGDVWVTDSPLGGARFLIRIRRTHEPTKR